MLLDEIKKRITQAMKDHNTVEKEVLRVALGEIQTNEARTKKDSTDEDVIAVVRKLVKSNQETLGMATDLAQKDALAHEIRVLESLLPATLSVAQIASLLASVADAIKAAGNDGQATGVAMKHLKSAGATVTGKDVTDAVKSIRARTTTA